MRTRTLPLLLICAIFVVFLVSCKGETGPAGADGSSATSTVYSGTISTSGVSTVWASALRPGSIVSVMYATSGTPNEFRPADTEVPLVRGYSVDFSVKSVTLYNWTAGDVYKITVISGSN